MLPTWVQEHIIILEFDAYILTISLLLGAILRKHQILISKLRSDSKSEVSISGMSYKVCAYGKD